jgi:hypothetical protein
VQVRFQHDGRLITRRAAHLFNALGREPNTAGLNLAAAGVKTRPNGQIVINRWQQTNARTSTRPAIAPARTRSSTSPSSRANSPPAMPPA